MSWRNLEVVHVVAVDQQHCIGRDNQMAWHIPADFKHFREITQGGVVVMGRKTFESIVSIIGKPLPDRTNIILTRQADYRAPDGVFVYTSLDKILEDFKDKELWSIGGGEIYKETLPYADKLFLTEVHQAVPGDAFFPEFDKNSWHETEREDKDGYSFVTYQKI